MNEQEMREKVINKLEELLEYSRYNDSVGWNPYNDTETLEDAIALLKAQEPRLVTESDFDGADRYGYIPVWTEEKDVDMFWECIPKAVITDPDGNVRHWTSRPTYAQRETVKWE